MHVSIDYLDDLTTKPPMAAEAAAETLEVVQPDESAELYSMLSTLRDQLYSTDYLSRTRQTRHSFRQCVQTRAAPRPSRLPPRSQPRSSAVLP